MGNGPQLATARCLVPESSDAMRDLTRYRGETGVGKNDTSSLVWRKSSASGASNCVEVAFLARSVRVRSSTDPVGQELAFSLPEWTAFLVGVRNGEFDYGPSSVAQHEPR